MGLNTSFGYFSEEVNMSTDTLNTGATMDIGAAKGNTIFVAGTNTVSSLGVPSQLGIIRTLVFTDAVTFTNSSVMQLFGNTDNVFIAGDVASFVSISTTDWLMFYRVRPGFIDGEGRINDDTMAPGSVGTLQLADACLTHSKFLLKTITAWADTTNIAVAADLINGIYTAVPTANRSHQLPLATNIIGILTGYQVGTSFEFTVVNTAAFNITLTANTGLTLVGNMIVNNSSATFIGVITSATTITIYRKS